MNERNLTPRKVPAGRGVDWITEGYGLFRRDIGAWIGIAVIWLVLIIAVPRGWIALRFVLNLLTPVISGGLMLGCDAQMRGEPLRIEHFWAGFTGELSGRLFMLSLYSLLGLFVVVFAAATVLGGMFGSAVLSSGGLESLELGTTAVLGLLVALLVLTPVMMALWFAPALVALQGMAPLAALQASLRGCLANMLPLSVNGLVALVIAIIATLPLGLGWLVALPVFTISIYFSYRDIFAPALISASPSI